MIAGCNRLNTHSELIISDGRYSLRSHAFKRGDPNDERIMELIESQKLYVGMKIRCINHTLTTMAEDGQPKNSSFVKPSSKHFFLGQVDKLRLQLNFNGLTRAKGTDKLGQSAMKYVPRCLSNVL